VPIYQIFDRDSNGKPMGCSDFAQLNAARSGYQLSFGDRQVLLQIMYAGIGNKKKILKNKKIVDIIHSGDGVTAKCEDGTSYSGDVLLGADGVYSKTRQTLWDLAAVEHPEEVKKDRNALAAEYQCLFGTCSKVDGLEIGEADYGWGEGRSTLVVCCKDGRTYYFIFQKLDTTYPEPAFRTTPRQRRRSSPRRTST